MQARVLLYRGTSELQSIGTMRTSIRPDPTAASIALALAAADIGVWEWSNGEGMVQVNARWSEMVGYAQGELDLSGFNWYELVHPVDLAIVHEDALKQANASAQGQFRVEFRMRHKSGRWVWIESRGQVVERDATGTPIRLAGAHLDVTERRAIDEVLNIAHAAAVESEARFRALTELSSDWYWEQDTEFRFTNFTGNLTSAVHPAQGELGMRRWEIPTLNMSEADWQVHKETLQNQQTFRDLEVHRIAKDGRSLWVSVAGAPFYSVDGTFLGYRGIGHDITARKEAEETIKKLAFFDVLTQLPNRQLMMERLQDVIATSRRDHHHGALLFIDLDNFKQLNDSKGHQTGDLLLQQVAQRLKIGVREVDTVARLGGDEFVVILKSLDPNLQKAAVQARWVGQKLLVALNEPYDLDGYEHHGTPSIGATLFSGTDTDRDELLKRADLAMYQAKADGRNLLRFFDPAMQAAVAERNRLEAELRLALIRDEISVVYQPVVDTHRQVMGYEALARWDHATRGMVPPQEFIALAEDSGLILQLGAQVLRVACLQLAQWAKSSGSQALTLAVNVSARQFRQRDFVAVVSGTLRETGARPQQLKLELTESLLLNDLDDVVAKMNQLRALGVGFSLDDFGTGYSSLSYLKTLPLDQLKIDKGFVQDVLDDPSDAAIAVSILTLAQALKLDVVAEGVETEGQMAFLAQHGCRAFQGYLFGKPAPLSGFAKL